MKTDGKDSRFAKIRDKPPFLFALFMAQAAWVSLCLLPVSALNALPLLTFTALSPVASSLSVAGLGIYAFGLAFEVVADQQKTQWMKEKQEKKHSEEFLTHGLWSKSRHPNYFGETPLWAAIAPTAAAVLASSAGQAAIGWSGTPPARLAAIALAAASPLASALILIKVCLSELSVGMLSDFVRVLAFRPAKQSTTNSMAIERIIENGETT